MRKSLLFLIGTLSFMAEASGTVGGHVPDGTNVWVGAASGGSWADEANWRAESPKGWTVKELFARHCVYDLRGLEGGAVVTNDLVCANVYKENSSGAYTMVAGIVCDGAADDVWTIRQKGGKGLYFCCPCRLQVDGGTLVWDDCAGEMYPYKQPNKYGTGEFLFHRVPNMWEAEAYVHEGTLGFTNDAGTVTYRWKIFDGATLAVRGGSRTAISQVHSSSTDGTKAVIDIAEDAMLRFYTGFNNYISGYLYYGDVTGSGTLEISGGGVHRIRKGAREALSFTGTVRPYLGELELGTASAPVALDPAVGVDVAGAGWLRLFGDQAVSALSGAGCDGGVEIPAVSALTVAGTDAPSTNVYAGRVAGGDFVKRGADSALVLKGGLVNAGATRVEEGTLALVRGMSRRNLRAYWNFDDPDDMGADVSMDGALPLQLERNPAVRPRLVEDGVSGRAVHFGDGQNMTKSGIFHRADTNDASAIAAIPSGVFTVSFWMRPTKGKCGSGTNFIHFDYGSGELVTNETGVVVKKTGWGSGIFFGSSHRDEDTAQAIPAFKNLCAYFGVGWTRGGVWNDGGTSKKNAAMVAIAKFDDADYLFDGAWHHVVGTYSNRVMRIFVDGTLMDERTRDGDLVIPPNPSVQIGNYSSGDALHCYQGDVDEIQWLAEAWSEANVRAEYEAHQPVAFRRSLPQPLAHWTFDEQNADGSFTDVTGNGFDLVSASSNGTAVVKHESVTYSGESGLAGGAAVIENKSGAYLKLKDGADMTSRLPAGSSFTIVMRCAYPGDNPYFIFGDGTAARSVRLGDSGCPRVQYWCVGDDNRISMGDCGTYGSGNSVLQSAYCMNALVYDAPGKTLRLYRDGALVGRATKAFSINPTTLQWGCVGGRYFNNLRMDDLRIYDEALSPGDVAQVVRSVRYGAGVIGPQPVLSADSPVVVAAGATLEAHGAEAHGAKSLSGADAVKVVGAAAFHAGDYAGFSGTIGGTGRLLVEKGQTIPLDAAQISADVGFMDDVVVVSSASSATPLVRASGKVLLPASGTLKLSDATTPGSFLGKRFLLAECADAEFPADASAWKFEPSRDGMPPLAFEFASGRLWAKVGGGGTLFIFR